MVVPIVLAIVLVLLLICSAFVSASELAYFSLSPADIDELSNSDSANDKLVLKLKNDPDILLSTILIANNLVNVSIVIVSTRLMVYLLGNNLSPVWEFLINSVLITFLLLLFGENMPKIYASSNSLRFARRGAFILNILRTLLYPFSWLLVKPTRQVKRLEKHTNNSVSIDDLSQALEITSNDINEDKEILEGIIKFGNINAGNAMTPRVDVVALDDDASFQEVLDLINEAGYSRIPVYHEQLDEIRGILFVKDLLCHLNDPNFAWQKIIRKPFFVPESKHINILLEDFQKNKTHIAIVVDEFGGTAGIITMEDILEEIVGDISDEYDEDEEHLYAKLNEHTYLFEAKILLNDFFKIPGIDRKDFEKDMGEAETLAGFILEMKGEIPPQGTEIKYKDYRFIVVSSDKRRIKTIKLIIPTERKEDEEAAK